MAKKSAPKRNDDVTEEEDYKEAEQAINAFFSDTSRPREDTRQGLLALKDEIDSMLAAMKEDDRRMYGEG